MHHAYVHTDTQTHIRRHVYADTQTCIMYTSIRTKTRRHEECVAVLDYSKAHTKDLMAFH